MSLINNPIALVFISYGIGAIFTSFLKSSGLIKHLSNLNFISDDITKKLGVLHFGWVVKNSFMRIFNKEVYLKGKRDKESLLKLIDEMTAAEVGHLIGFVVLLILNIYMFLSGVDPIYAAVFALINIVFNLYLVFLQQFNKRRICKVVERM